MGDSRFESIHWSNRIDSRDRIETVEFRFDKILKRAHCTPIKTALSIYFRFGRPVGMVGSEWRDNFQPNAPSRSTATPLGSSPKHRQAVASVPCAFFSSFRRYRRAISQTSARLHGNVSCPYNEAFITSLVHIRQLSDGHQNRDFQKLAVNRLKWPRLTGQPKKTAGLTTLGPDVKNTI